MKLISITLTALITVIMSGVNPDILAKNVFLKEMISNQLVSILVVILTVTMASVANIHISIGRVRKRLFDNRIDISKEVEGSRKELSDDAWYLFGSFCVLIFVLFISGDVSNKYIISLIYSVVIVIIVLNLAILYDIYMSVYELAALDDGLYTRMEEDDDGEMALPEDEKS